MTEQTMANVDFFKIHNLQLEIKQLEAELQKASSAYKRLGTQLRAERELHKEELEKERKRGLFYKGKFMLLAFGKKK